MEVKDLVGLSKPVTKLIESVGSAAGVLYEPTRVRRLARAEADGAVIRAEGEAAASSIHERATRRMVEEAIRRQQNLDEIVVRAAKALPSVVSAEPTDPDWIAAFLASAENTSNPDVQELWARLIAGEVAAPGRFSRRTIFVIREMERADAALFSRLVNSCPALDCCVLHWPDKFVQGAAEISYSDFEHLETLGLIKFDGNCQYCLNVRDADKDGLWRIIVFDRAICLDLSRANRDENGGYKLPMGCAVFTQYGEEIASLVDRCPINGACEYLLGKWERFMPASPWPRLHN